MIAVGAFHASVGASIGAGGGAGSARPSSGTVRVFLGVPALAACTAGRKLLVPSASARATVEEDSGRPRAYHWKALQFLRATRTTSIGCSRPRSRRWNWKEGLLNVLCHSLETDLGSPEKEGVGRAQREEEGGGHFKKAKNKPLGRDQTAVLAWGLCHRD